MPQIALRRWSSSCSLCLCVTTGIQSPHSDPSMSLDGVRCRTDRGSLLCSCCCAGISAHLPWKPAQSSYGTQCHMSPKELSAEGWFHCGLCSLLLRDPQTNVKWKSTFRVEADINGTVKTIATIYWTSIFSQGPPICIYENVLIWLSQPCWVICPKYGEGTRTQWAHGKSLWWESWRQRG